MSRAEDPSSLATDRFARWVRELELRHLADLTLPEVRRGLQALSARYVERRATLTEGAALDGAGKRAAFALFYAPLHYLVVEHVSLHLDGEHAPPRRLVDLGCGSGSAAAGWAAARGAPERLLGVDRNPWALAEARWNWIRLGLHGTTRRGDLLRRVEGGRGDALLLAYTVNELDPSRRDALGPRLAGAAQAGARLLVVEPIARRLTPWWDAWCEPLLRLPGARVDEWRLTIELPGVLGTLARGARLRGEELTARTLYVAPG